MKRLKERKEWEMNIIVELLDREKEIEEIVAEMIADGKVP